MKIRTIAATLLSTALVGAGASVPAQAGGSDPVVDRSLAIRLSMDGNQFDRNPLDHDIVTEALLAVLDAKPDSPLAVVNDGEVALTAFLPNDASFHLLVKELTGEFSLDEPATFGALVDAAGLDTVEEILLYHVVPGATIDKATALDSDGATLDTALEGVNGIRVDVLSRRLGVVKLRDNDQDYSDAVLDPLSLNINKGNKQIAHGTLLVLRPIDL